MLTTCGSSLSFTLEALIFQPFFNDNLAKWLHILTEHIISDTLYKTMGVINDVILNIPLLVMGKFVYCL